MSGHPGNRYLVTPAIYNLFSADDLLRFVPGQVQRFRVPFDLYPAPSQKYERTCFVLDTGKSGTYDHLSTWAARDTDASPEFSSAAYRKSGETLAFFVTLSDTYFRASGAFLGIYRPGVEQLTSCFVPRERGSYLFHVPDPGTKIWIGGKEVKDKARMEFDINAFPIMIEGRIPYPPQVRKATSLLRFTTPSGQTRDLDEDCLTSCWFFSGVGGRYYTSLDKNAKPAHQRWDLIIDFTCNADFGVSDPILRAVWQGVFLTQDDGSYEFKIVTSDRARLVVDGQDLIDTDRSSLGTLELVRGVPKIELRYERKPNANNPPELHLYWKRPGVGHFELMPLRNQPWSYD